jgi:hypothetical protein
MDNAPTVFSNMWFALESLKSVEHVASEHLGNLAADSVQ